MIKPFDSKQSDFKSGGKRLEVIKTDTGKMKADFNKAALLPIIQNFTHLQGYESPLPTLNELLREVEQFNDSNLRFNLFLNVHYVCNENLECIWGVGHRKEISEWLRKANFVALKIGREQNKPLFDTTWEIQEVELKKNQADEKIDPVEEELILAFKENKFFDLPLLACLNESNQDKLINLIRNGTKPFKIAMLEHLGIIKHLKEELLTRSKVEKKLGIILKMGERAVKGNINSFNSKSTDRPTYKAYTQIDEATNAYNQLTLQK